MQFNLIQAAPDDGVVRARRAAGRNTARIEFPGLAPLSRVLRRRGAALNEIWLGPCDKPLRPGPAPDRPFVNERGVVEVYGVALAQAETLLDRLGRPPVFNHPRRVRELRPDLLFPRLSKLAGVGTPRTARARPRRRDDVAAAVAVGGLRWPVRVRPTGARAAAAGVRLDGPDDLAVLDALPLDGREVVLREETAPADEVRAAFIGGRAFIVSGDIDSASDACALLRRVDHAAGLDYVLVEARVEKEGNVTILGVGACADVFDTPGVEDAFLELVAEPSRWRGGAVEESA